MTRPTEDILNDISVFEPDEGNWLRLDDLLAELWQTGLGPDALPCLFRVFERYPDEDGAGVLWSIVHGIESLDLDYEQILRESIGRQHSLMGKILLDRLEQSKTSQTKHGANSNPGSPA